MPGSLNHHHLENCAQQGQTRPGDWLTKSTWPSDKRTNLQILPLTKTTKIKEVYRLSWFPDSNKTFEQALNGSFTEANCAAAYLNSLQYYSDQFSYAPTTVASAWQTGVSPTTGVSFDNWLNVINRN